MTEPYQPYPREPSIPVPAGQPLPPSLPGHVTGVASGVQARVEGSTQDRRGMTVLNFRVHPGDRDQPIEVELRGYTLVGTVRDGDVVAIPGPVAASGRLEPARLQNLTTGTAVTTTGPARAGRTCGIVIVSVLVAIILLVIGLVALRLFASA